jgi:hypothetical protein
LPDPRFAGGGKVFRGSGLLEIDRAGQNDPSASRMLIPCPSQRNHSCNSSGPTGRLSGQCPSPPIRLLTTSSLMRVAIRRRKPHTRRAPSPRDRSRWPRPSVAGGPRCPVLSLAPGSRLGRNQMRFPPSLLPLSPADLSFYLRFSATKDNALLHSGPKSIHVCCLVLMQNVDSTEYFDADSQAAILFDWFAHALRNSSMNKSTSIAASVDWYSSLHRGGDTNDRIYSKGLQHSSAWELRFFYPPTARKPDDHCTFL